MHQPESIGAIYLAAVRNRFASLKSLADRAEAQLTDGELHIEPRPGSNSVAVTMKHIAGNQRSRWTEFLTSDGEKPTRNRDGEFEEDLRMRSEIRMHWEEGWDTLDAALSDLVPGDLTREVRIRGRSQSVIAAIERQLAHYGYHVGQIVYVARMLRGKAWETLSIERGASETYREDP